MPEVTESGRRLAVALTRVTRLIAVQRDIYIDTVRASSEQSSSIRQFLASWIPLVGAEITGATNGTHIAVDIFPGAGARCIHDGRW